MEFKYPDYHIHTKLCGHATGETEEYVDYAISKGLKYIGFSDHSPLLFQPENSIEINKLSMKLEELHSYYESIQNLKQQYINDISIAIGLEVDFFLGDYEIFEYVDRLDFDYLIGSVHFINGWGFDQDVYKKVHFGLKADNFYQRYYDNLLEMVKCNKFNILGHFDLPKKFKILPELKYPEKWQEILNVMKENNIALEINTSGIDKPAGIQYPDYEIIKMACNTGVPIITGSDAHQPVQVGRYFNKVDKIIKDCNTDNIIYFLDKKMIRMN